MMGGVDMQERFESFTLLISHIARYIRRIKTEEMAEHDLKSPHLSCIYYLYKKNTLTATELCELCDEDKAAISRSIVYLEENGYINCISKAKKRYKSPFELTEKGRAVGEALSVKIDKVLDATSQGISDEERAIMYRALTLICNNLRDISEDYNEEQ